MSNNHLLIQLSMLPILALQQHSQANELVSNEGLDLSPLYDGREIRFRYLFGSILVEAKASVVVLARRGIPVPSCKFRIILNC